MASSTPSTTTPLTKHPFEKKVEEVRVSKSDINDIVMEYLITEGYPLAARSLAVEANMQPTADFESIRRRVEIRESIHSGDLQTAIEKINELDPQLLDTNASLHFTLLKLRLIDLIRAFMTTKSEADRERDLSIALDFATTYLAPQVATNKDFKDQFELVMVLLFQKINDIKPESASLLDPALRKQVADEVNKAILAGQKLKPDARLRYLIRLRQWSEARARELGRNLPNRLGLSLDEEDFMIYEAGDTVMEGNGISNGHGDAAEAMVTT